MIDKKFNILIISFIVAFISYSFWRDLKDAFDIQIFYKGLSLSFVGYTYVIYLFAKDYKKRYFVFWSKIVFLTAVNSLVDELLFDPTKLQINEYIGFILTIIITYLDHGRNK
tara:strand:- start:570 stop:905 length:336 start_codon:yes stop_codon:yes gene_type:complete